MAEGCKRKKTRVKEAVAERKELTICSKKSRSCRNIRIHTKRKSFLPRRKFLSHLDKCSRSYQDKSYMDQSRNQEARDMNKKELPTADHLEPQTGDQKAMRLASPKDAAMAWWRDLE